MCSFYRWHEDGTGIAGFNVAFNNNALFWDPAMRSCIDIFTDMLEDVEMDLTIPCTDSSILRSSSKTSNHSSGTKVDETPKIVVAETSKRTKDIQNDCCNNFQ